MHAHNYFDVERSLDNERTVEAHVLDELLKQSVSVPVSPADSVVSSESADPRPKPVDRRA